LRLVLIRSVKNGSALLPSHYRGWYLESFRVQWCLRYPDLLWAIGECS